MDNTLTAGQVFDAVLQRTLQAASEGVLLDAMVQLTHKVHGADDPDRKAALRQQRDLVRAELLRRLQP